MLAKREKSRDILKQVCYVLAFLTAYIRISLALEFEVLVLSENAVQVSWARAPLEQGMYFKVTYHPRENSSDIHVLKTISKKEVISDLLPCTEYSIHVQTCAGSSCSSEEGAKSVTTLPSELSPPTVKSVRAESTLTIRIDIDDDVQLAENSDRDDDGQDQADNNGSSLKRTVPRCDQTFDEYFVGYCRDQDDWICKSSRFGRNISVIELKDVELDQSYSFFVAKVFLHEKGLRQGKLAFGRFHTTPVLTSKPRNLTATVLSPAAVHLAWIPPDQTGLLDYYEISYIDNPSNRNNLVKNCTTNEMTIADLDPNLDYTFVVRGCSVFGCGPPESIEVELLVSERLTPNNLTGRALAGSAVRLTWLPADAGHLINRYQVTHTDDEWEDCFATETVVTGLNPHTNYTFSVRSCTAYGCGTPACITIETYSSAPSKVEDLQATFKPEGRIQISWCPSEIPGGSRTGYFVFWTCGNSEMFKYLQETDADSYTVENITDPTKCAVGVRACNHILKNLICSDKATVSVASDAS